MLFRSNDRGYAGGVVSFTQGSHGSVASGGTGLVYTPTTGAGPDQFGYTITDGRGNYASATVSVTRRGIILGLPPLPSVQFAVNDTDTYTDDVAFVGELRRVRVTLRDGSNDGESVTFSAVDPNSVGSSRTPSTGALLLTDPTNPNSATSSVNLTLFNGVSQEIYILAQDVQPLPDSFLLEARFTTALAGNAILVELRPDPVPAIEFKDSEGDTATRLSVGTLQYAFSPPGGERAYSRIKPNFLDLDPHRFFIQVTYDPANRHPNVKDKITVRIK